jgi:hypothetical protein
MISTRVHITACILFALRLRPRLRFVRDVIAPNALPAEVQWCCCFRGDHSRRWRDWVRLMIAHHLSYRITGIPTSDSSYRARYTTAPARTSLAHKSGLATFAQSHDAPSRQCPGVNTSGVCPLCPSPRPSRAKRGQGRGQGRPYHSLRPHRLQLLDPPRTGPRQRAT